MELWHTWLSSIWVFLIALLLAAVAKGHRRVPLLAAAVVLAFTASIPLLPESKAEQPRQSATQIVYRFDNSRYLSLTGYACEGTIDFVDETKGIRTRVIHQFARVFLPDFVHSDIDSGYIIIPYEDASAFRVSKDYGRTFRTVRWIGTRPWAREITRITVAGRQAFIEIQDGRLFMTSNPADNDRWGMGVIDPVNVLPNKVHRDYPEWQNLPTEVPPVENYKGWTQMRCDPDLLGEPMETAGTRWNRFQQQVSDVLARTTGDLGCGVLWLSNAVSVPWHSLISSSFQSPNRRAIPRVSTEVLPCYALV